MFSKPYHFLDYFIAFVILSKVLRHILAAETPFKNDKKDFYFT